MEPRRQARIPLAHHERRRPEATLLYELVEMHYPAFLAALVAVGPAGDCIAVIDTLEE